MTAPPGGVLDCRGQRCPLPVIALARAAAAAAPGTVLELWADDPAAATDVPAWCRLRGAEVLQVRAVSGTATSYQVRVGT